MRAILSCALAAVLAGVLAAGPARADGWSVARQEGRAWLVDPQGRRFYSKGVNIVHGWPDQGMHEGDQDKALGFPAFFWKKRFPDEDAWRRHAGRELAGWGFNTRGGWSDVSPEIGLPYVVELDLGRAARLHWIDLFDPGAEEAVERAAERLTAPYRGDPLLIGYFTDNEVGWWNSRIFRHYLNDPWSSHAKQAVWGMIRDRYAGDWAALLVDFVPGPGVTGWEDLQGQGAFLALRPGGQGVRLINEVCGAVARRYYSLVRRGLKKAHPQALVMGDRLPLYYNQHAALAMRDHVDVVSTNYNVDVQNGWIAPYYFEGLEKLTGRPVLVSEFFYAARENRSGNVNNGHLMTVDTQAERAQGAAEAVRGFARFPGVVGSHWFQYHDEPPQGRQDGENYNFGLADVHDQPYELLTASLTAAHAEVEAIHAQAPTASAAPVAAGVQGSETFPVAKPVEAGGAILLRRAAQAVSVTDDSLLDWDMAATRLTGWETPAPFVPFGDVHAAWRPEGLYLACIAQSYLDWTALAYEGRYPLSESFQLHVRVTGPDGPRHYAVCLSPERSSRFYDYDKPKMETPPRLYRCENGAPAHETEAPGAGLVQAISRPLPHIAFEVFLPAALLGFERLAPGQGLDLSLWATSFYRDQTMTWKRTAPDAAPVSVRLEGAEAGAAAAAMEGRP